MFKLGRENDLVTNIFQFNVNYAKYELQKNVHTQDMDGRRANSN